MLGFVMSVAIGVIVAFVWVAIWAGTLHALGMPVLVRTADVVTHRERLVRMGKWRYVFIFGVLGQGLAFGLGIAAAGLVSRDYANWARAAVILAVVSLVGGIFQGAKTWNQMFRVEVPFPPHYPPLNNHESR